MGWFARLIGREARSTTPTHPRDPALAELWGFGWKTASGIAVTPDTAMRAPAVAASVRLLSDTIATIPLDLFEKVGENDRRRATGQSLHGLVHDTPNGWMTSVDWRRRLMNGLCLRGNQYNFVAWNGAGQPERIEPLPSTVVPFRAEGSVWYRVTRGGKSETLPAMNVLHFRGPFQSGDNLEADSPVVIGKELIGQSLAAAEYIARFFQNGAVPKVGVKIPSGIGNDAAKRLRDQFEERHKGVENAHKLAILDGGMELATIGMTNDQAQFVEIYKQTASEIGSRLYGIPPHLTGDTEKQTSWGTGIEQMDIGFVKHVVRPYLVGIEQALNLALLTAAGRQRFYFEFNVEGLLRGDFKSRMEGYALLIQWGVATVNEVRRRENMAPIDGGDVRLTPLNYAPADRIMDVLLKEPSAAKRDLIDIRMPELPGGLNGKEHGYA